MGSPLDFGAIFRKSSWRRKMDGHLSAWQKRKCNNVYGTGHRLKGKILVTSGKAAKHLELSQGSHTEGEESVQLTSLS
jgi:hypothetical protein